MSDPTKILFDARVLGVAMVDPRARTGICRAVEELLDCLVRDRDFSIQLYDSSENFFCCQAFIEEKKKHGYILFRTARFWWIKFYVWKLAKIIRRHVPSWAFFQSVWVVSKEYYKKRERKRTGHGPVSFHIYHSSMTIIPQDIRNMKNIINIVTLYDLIPVLFPYFLESQALSGQKHPVCDMVDSLRSEDFVICISESTRNDLLAYRKDLVPERVFTAPLAASPKFFPVNDPGRIDEVKRCYRIPVEKRYILSVCTLEPRKNLETVVRAFGAFVRQNKIEDVVLVLAGSVGWKYESLLRQIDATGELKKKIVLTGFVPDEDLVSLYSGAMVFVYLSFYEGFGLPPLEAMQCGTPVITSNTSSLPEVVGNAGIMIDPRDEQGAMRYFFRFYHDSGYRKEFSQKALARAKQFSWDAHCEAVKKIYRIASEKAVAKDEKNRFSSL